MNGTKHTKIYIPAASIWPNVRPYISFEERNAENEVVKINALLSIVREPTRSGSPEEIDYSVKLISLSVKIDSVAKRVPTLASSFVSKYGEEPRNSRNQTIPQFLLHEFLKISGKIRFDEEYSATEVPKKRTFTDIDFASIPESLQLRSTWESLNKKKPIKAYCVARALQLLSPDGIYGKLSKVVRTSICDTRFSLQKTGSLPEPRGDIFKSKGLLTLNNLFYDVIKNASPAMAEMTKTKHDQFLKELKFVFEETKEIENVKSPLLPIRDERPSELCGQKDGPLYTENAAMIRQMRGYVGQLLTRQMEHTRNVMKLMSKLFVVSEAGLYLQNSVQERGMPEVNRIAEEARDLLMNYYKDCEITYRMGVTEASKNPGVFTPV
jgi:hypothetical protein